MSYEKQPTTTQDTKEITSWTIRAGGQNPAREFSTTHEKRPKKSKKGLAKQNKKAHNQSNKTTKGQP